VLKRRNIIYSESALIERSLMNKVTKTILIKMGIYFLLLSIVFILLHVFLDQYSTIINLTVGILNILYMIYMNIHVSKVFSAYDVMTKLTRGDV